MTADIHTRPYVTADRDAVMRLVGEVLAEHGFSLATGGLERDLAEAHATYGGARAGFWVAVRGEEVVGTVAVRPRSEDTCEIKRLYLRADMRGAGLGQALYAHAEAFARAAGYGSIWLDSSRRFQKARALYERNGFVLLEELDNEWEDNVYEKRLK
jgi:GNAT superfamily N-acetyltransferase